jgi:hypothetical protein
MHKDHPFPRGNRFKLMMPFRWLFIAGSFLALSLAVMLLWNALMPELFGLKVIGYLQALGLLILCRVLFGGFHFRGFPGGRDPRAGFFKERFRHMSEEERERFRNELRSRL